MSDFRFLSRIEQMSVFLRGELEAGRWEGMMPGRLELAAVLGLTARAAEQALRQLEREGVLVSQGAGRKRRIATPQTNPQKGLRLGILMYERQDRTLPYHVDLGRRLEEAGHVLVLAGKTLTELGLEVGKVTRMVKEMKVDAWIVEGGPKEILAWFAKQKLPVMAEFGRFSGLSIAGAGVRKIPALRVAIRRLFELGHRRMVMLVREERRKPCPALHEQAFLDEMGALGIKTGSYHLPDWENNAAGFHRCIDSLFQHTPPTALFLSEAKLFVAAHQHLARIGKIAPRDVSLVCDDPDIAFSWCDPPVSHIHWDSRPVVSRVLNWADRVSHGVEDRTQGFTLADFVEGGTIGPARKR